MKLIKDFINKNFATDVFFNHVESLLFAINKETGKTIDSIYVGNSHTIVIEEKNIYRENNDTGKIQKFKL